MTLIWKCTCTVHYPLRCIRSHGRGLCYGLVQFSQYLATRIYNIIGNLNCYNNLQHRLGVLEPDTTVHLPTDESKIKIFFVFTNGHNIRKQYGIDFVRLLETIFIIIIIICFFLCILQSALGGHVVFSASQPIIENNSRHCG